MSISVDRSEREVIPRLRDTRSAIALGEVAPLDVCEPKVVGPRELRELEHKVREFESERTIPFAADAIGAALVFGEPERVTDAARFVVESDAPPMVLRLARSVLGEDVSWDDRESDPTARVRMLRNRLRAFPGNALNWLDLSQAQALSANNAAAVKAMNVALALLPDHRLALRSAARLFVQVGEHDRALWHLRESPATKDDPWLVAAEIAVARDGRLAPKLAGLGKRMIAAESLPPFHLSELKSAVGTMELGASGSRRGRQLLRSSLDNPSENAVAQAEWVSSMKHISLPLSEEVIGESTEATAIDAYAQQDWPLAFERALRWYEEEPISSQAVMLASHMAATMDARYEDAIPLLEFGIRANEDNWSIWNNLAFCQVMAGRYEEAAATLRQAHKFSTLEPAAYAYFSATAGLLAYRIGLPIEGRALYARALEAFSQMPGDQKENRANAAAYWAQEESRLREGIERTVVEHARRLTSDVKRPYLAEIMERVERQMQTQGMPGSGITA